MRAALLSSLLSLSGCQIFGIAAMAIPNMIPAAYTGLKGKSTAVYVWTDRAISGDWPTMNIDIAAGVQKKLLAGQAEDKPDALEGTTFPVTPQSMALFQLNHPEVELQPITTVAPQVGVQRLIYIEIVGFQTRSDLEMNTNLFKGQLVANIKVVDCDGPQAKVVYEENNVTVKFPKKGPSDGVVNLGDGRTYVGTVDAFTTLVAWRFYRHEEEREAGQ
jgi:hypothetical protein